MCSSSCPILSTFLLLTHSHSRALAGDKVQLASDGPSVYVTRMELMTTQFRCWDGRCLTIPNHVLHDYTIYNIKRSGGQTDTFSMTVGYHTSMDMITKLGDDFMQFCRQQPNDYNIDKCGWYLREIRESAALIIEFYAAQQTNWQTGLHFPRRHEMLKFLKSRCEAYEIEYFPPVNRSVLHFADDDGGE
eukprot:m.138994 g.138994  ORF g.138994 m.138994 type:complete len:189 (+) comp14931_c1_seq3:29-595(+)